MQIFPFLLIFVIFYFLMIRPQQKRVKDHQAMIAAVKELKVRPSAGSPKKIR